MSEERWEDIIDEDRELLARSYKALEIALDFIKAHYDLNSVPLDFVVTVRDELRSRT